MIFDLLLTLFLVLLNAFFVAAEFSIVKVRLSQLHMDVQSGKRLAKCAMHIVSHLDAYLAATQLGITFASLGLGWIGEPVVARLITSFMALLGVEMSQELAHDLALPIAFALITTLHIVFGELAPKSIALQRSVGTALTVALPLHLFYIIFKPFIYVLNGFANFILRLLGLTAVSGSEVHSSEELKYLVQQQKESGSIEQMDFDLIKKAFDFSEISAKQVMIPRKQVFAIDLRDFAESTIEKMIEEGYSRVPCYDGNFDNVIGVLSLKDVLVNLRKKVPIATHEVLRSVMVVPETKRISQLLKDLQTKHQQMAIVTNEYGETTGIVTMEDILEELVGEIHDEYDVEVDIVEKTAHKTYTIVASASLEAINAKLPHPIEKDEQYETLAGLLLLKFGKIPSANERITIGEYEFTILKKSKNSIVLVKARHLEEI